MIEYLLYGLILFTFFRLLKGLAFISVDEHTGKWHHFYTGIVFSLSGNSLTIRGKWIGFIFILIGLWLMGDDLYQHWKHGHGYITYRSPVHRLGIPLYRLREDLIKKYSWLEWLNKF